MENRRGPLTYHQRKNEGIDQEHEHHECDRGVSEGYTWLCQTEPSPTMLLVLVILAVKLNLFSSLAPMMPSALQDSSPHSPRNSQPSSRVTASVTDTISPTATS